MVRSILFVALLASVAFGLGSPAARAASPDNTLYLDLKDGRVVIELRPDLAPQHVERIKKLVKEGFYDGLSFHRVIAELHGPNRRSQGRWHGRLEVPERSRGIHANAVQARNHRRCAFQRP